MAATQGFNAVIEVSSDDVTYSNVGIANDASANLQAAMLDVTQFGDSAIDRIAGLFDTPISFSGHYDNSDTGQALILTQFLARNSIYAQFKPDGTNGFKVECRVESYEFAATPDGTSTFSVSLQSISAPSTSLT